MKAWKVVMVREWDSQDRTCSRRRPGSIPPWTRLSNARTPSASPGTTGLDLSNNDENHLKKTIFISFGDVWMVAFVRVKVLKEYSGSNYGEDDVDQHG